MRGINLERELKNLRKAELKKGEDKVLEAFKRLLDRMGVEDDKMLRNLFNDSETLADIDYRLLDPDRIFNEDQIKKLCTVFRLRFLSSKHFKGEIPYEALIQLKRMQKKQNTQFNSFRILAPAAMFNLVNKDKDPMLFVPLGNKHYYLVHKWGSDLSPFRKLSVFPFRNLKTLLFTIAFFAFTITALIPDSVILAPRTEGSTFGVRGILFFYCVIAFSGLTTLYGFSRLKNFNSALWDSRYLD